MWVGTSLDRGFKEAALAGAGVALTLWALYPLSDDDPATPGNRRLCGLALRMHRCALVYVFCPSDHITASALPALARLAWLLLAKSGVVNVLVVTIATGVRYHSLTWLLLEQSISAALLVRQAPAVCSAIAAQPPLASLLQVPTLLQQWVALPLPGPEAGAYSSSHASLVLPCKAAMAFLIINCVVAVPLCWGWGKCDPEGSPWLQLSVPLTRPQASEVASPAKGKGPGGKCLPNQAGASPAVRRRSSRRHRWGGRV